MSDVLELPFLATDGRIPTSVWERLGETVSRLPGKRFIITLKEQKRKRSLNQNAYMWGVVIKHITDAFREAGNNVDSDDVFSFLKAEVWKVTQVFVTSDGEVLRGPGSSRTWTTMEMELRLEQARAWAAEVLGIGIPLPNESLPDAEDRQ
jgi:hypothetical protein